MPTPGSNNVAQPSSTNVAVEEFSTFYRNLYESALHFVIYRADGADCEALVADAFLVAWQHYQRVGSVSRGWFYGVLRNKIGDFYRSARRREVPAEILDTRQSPDDQTSRCDDHLDVVRVLQSLPLIHSEPLVLVYWCDLSAAEAAGVLGVREGSFRVRLHRAKHAFLKEHDRRARCTLSSEEMAPWGE